MFNKAIIFDLDGVIVNTAKYHYLAWKKIANDMGFEFTESENEKLKGVSRVQSLEYLLQSGNKTLTQIEKNKFLHQKNKDYLSMISHMDASEILCGISELLDDLVKNNIKFSLGSASKNARTILDTLQLTDKFDAIVDGNEVTKAKPDPEVFLIAAKKMGVKPNHCIVVEDSKAGIEAANAVGMISVGIGDKKILCDAKYLLNDTSELTYDFLTSI